MLAADGSGMKAIIPIWQEALLGAVAFGLLCLVLMRFVFPRMEAVFRARVEAVEGARRRAEVARVEAERLREEYRAEMAGARADAVRIRGEARGEAELERQRLLERAREEADRSLVAGRDRLAAERERVLRELRAEAETVAADLAGRILGESPAKA